MVVSPSCQQLTGLLSNTVPGLVNGSQGSPAHFREASAVEEVKSPVTHLHWDRLSLRQPRSLSLNPSSHFVRQSLAPGPLPSLTSGPLYQVNMTVEKATVDFWRLARRAAGPGVAAAALCGS